MTRRAALPLLLAAPVLLSACTGGDAPAVQVGDVVRADVSEVVDAPGTVTARSTSTLPAPADATVAAVVVPDGTAVTKGTVLVRLDSPAARQRLAQAESALASASTRVQLPRADLGPLQDQLDAAAEDAFAGARAAADQVPDPAARAAVLGQVAEAQARYRATSAAARSVAQSLTGGAEGLEDALSAVGGAQRVQAEALVASARATVDALTVTAPQDGVVTYGGSGGAGARGAASALGDLAGQLPPGLAGALPGAAPATGGGQVAVGAPVSSGATVATVTDVSGLGVTADVDETDVLLVRPGVPARVELDAVPGAAYEAVVTGVDVQPTSGSGGGVTYRARLDLRAGTLADGSPAPAPLPGMSAVVDLRVRDAPDAVSVPAAAVLRDGDTAAVVVQDGGTYRRRDVVLGATGEDRVEVVRGLAVGERVVVRDADQVRDGQPVRR